MAFRRKSRIQSPKGAASEDAITETELKSWRKYARKIARNFQLTGDDVEDAAQSAVIALWKESKRSGYLKKEQITDVLRKAVMAWLRSKDYQTRGQVYLEDVRGDSRVRQEGEDEGGFEIASDSDFTWVEVEAFLETLNTKERQIVLLRMDGLSEDEVAARMCMPRRSVNAVLQNLQKLMTEN